ncbi:hypothetical protein NFJ02_01g41220 [Pycnococcus provasolii]
MHRCRPPLLCFCLRFRGRRHLTLEEQGGTRRSLQVGRPGGRSFTTLTHIHPLIAPSMADLPSNDEHHRSGDVDAPVEKGRTLLHIAATMSSNTYDSCKVLIEKNANVNKQDKYGDTPLHLAAGNGYHNICKLLVENNANINQPNNKGNTPLHLAAEERHIDVIEILLDGGADTSIQNNVGNTARDVCEPVTRVRVTKALRCYILLGGDASELDSESESDESEVSGSHSSWDSDDS